MGEDTDICSEECPFYRQNNPQTEQCGYTDPPTYAEVNKPCRFGNWYATTSVEPYTFEEERALELRLDDLEPPDDDEYSEADIPF